MEPTRHDLRSHIFTDLLLRLTPCARQLASIRVTVLYWLTWKKRGLEASCLRNLSKNESRCGSFFRFCLSSCHHSHKPSDCRSRLSQLPTVWLITRSTRSCATRAAFFGSARLMGCRDLMVMSSRTTAQLRGCLIHTLMICWRRAPGK